ncbi:hypothetical protein PPOP_2355 [Paenibacillus popilliae ATCC 14706]|uniref:Uncharacterized protein n=1 Tax=Paenibacillus popilliae ATCC 14706 TaxID=1212764 RepID=M9LB34_PAEPP|nr:hypothetical protein PPOP_2355 [Paenibacillus popilliae ATCC 14706]
MTRIFGEYYRKKYNDVPKKIILLGRYQGKEYIRLHAWLELEGAIYIYRTVDTIF